MHFFGKKHVYAAVFIILLLLCSPVLAEESLATPAQMPADDVRTETPRDITIDETEPLSPQDNVINQALPQQTPGVPEASSTEETTPAPAEEPKETEESDSILAKEGTEEKTDRKVPSEEVAETELLPAAGEEATPCTETLFWQISAEGTELIFTGSGAMPTFESAEETPWHPYKDTVRKLVLPEGMTAIGAYAFSGFSVLERTTIRGSVETIGAYAFADCPALVEVIFKGECPKFDTEVFSLDTLRVRYPAAYESWQSFTTEGIGGNISLLPEKSEPGAEEEEQVPAGETTADIFGEDSAEALFYPEIRLNKAYILLEPGETFALTAEPNFEPENGLSWSLAGEAVTQSEGTLRALEPGVAYITVSGSYAGTVYSAVCCAEVAFTTPVVTRITGIQLITAAATVELFKTDYACIRILPKLEVTLSPYSDSAKTDRSGAVIEKAEFTNVEMEAYFSLRVKDNETLEIVPTQAAVQAAQENNGKIKSSYVTGIRITAGGEVFIPYESVRVKIKRSRPYVQVEPIQFNSYPAMLGEKLPLVFTGEKVIACTLMNNPPSWLEFDPNGMTVALSRTYVPDSYSGGRLQLCCEAEGWLVPAEVTVRYSGKCYMPKLTFSEKAVTVFAQTGDTAEITVKVTPTVYADYPVSLIGVEVQTGEEFLPCENGKALLASYENGVLRLSAPQAPEDGEEHIYRVTLSVLDKTYCCKVRVPAPGTVIKPALKTSGCIDPNDGLSAFIITPVRKNFHNGSEETYTLTAIEQYKGKTLINVDAGALFTVTEENGRFLIREKQAGTVPGGYTYRANVILKTSAGESTTAVTVKLNAAANTAAVKVTLSARGTLVPGDGAACLILTPSVRPRKKEEELALVFNKKKNGKAERIAAEECPFSVKENADGTFSLYISDVLETDALYYAQLLVNCEGKTYASGIVRLSVKK